MANAELTPEQIKDMQAMADITGGSDDSSTSDIAALLAIGKSHKSITKNRESLIDATQGTDIMDPVEADRQRVLREEGIPMPRSIDQEAMKDDLSELVSSVLKDNASMIKVEGEEDKDDTKEKTRDEVLSEKWDVDSAYLTGQAAKDRGTQRWRLNDLDTKKKAEVAALNGATAARWEKESKFIIEQQEAKKSVEKNNKSYEKDKLTLLKSREAAFKNANTEINLFNEEITKIANENPSTQVFGNIFSILAVAVGGYRAGLTGGSNQALAHLNKVVDQIARRNLGRINAIRGEISSEDRLLRNTLMKYDTEEQKVELLRSGIINLAASKIEDANTRYKLGLGDQQIAEMKELTFKRLAVESAEAVARLDTNHLALATALLRGRHQMEARQDQPLSHPEMRQYIKMDNVNNPLYRPYRKEVIKLNSTMKATMEMVDSLQEVYGIDPSVLERYMSLEKGDTFLVQAVRLFQDASLGDKEASRRDAMMSKLGGQQNARAFAAANPEQGKKITQKDFEITKGRFYKIYSEGGLVEIMKELRSQIVLDRARFVKMAQSASEANVYTQHPGMRASPFIEATSAQARIMSEYMIHPSVYGDGHEHQKALRTFLQNVVNPYVESGLMPAPSVFETPLTEEVLKQTRLKRRIDIRETTGAGKQ